LQPNAFKNWTRPMQLIMANDPTLKLFTLLLVACALTSIQVEAWVPCPISSRVPWSSQAPSPDVINRFESRLVLGVASKDDDKEDSSERTPNLCIRDPTYREMNFVADTIMKCFYQDSKPPARQLYRLGELNRIQQNFAYDREKHRMWVAAVPQPEGGHDKIVAFCDIDDRRPNVKTTYKYNPRPYLSDLCVDPDYRRQGIAQRLVEQCEDFCRSLKKEEVFIRVERTNEAALNMYTKLGYSEFTHPDDDSEKVMLLRKELVEHTEDEHETACTDKSVGVDAVA